MIKSSFVVVLHFSPTDETDTESEKAPEQIRIKTLEEIRQEKAAKSQSQQDDPSVASPESNRTKNTKGAKRAITVKDDPISRVKTFSEILRAKKRRQEEQEQNTTEPSPVKAKRSVEKAPGKSQGESDTTGPGPEDTNVGKVKVKTLEEIRREKAAKSQARQAPEAENEKSSNTEQNDAKKPRLLHVKKPASQSKTAHLCVDTRNVCRIVVYPTAIKVFRIELHFEFDNPHFAYHFYVELSRQRHNREEC